MVGACAARLKRIAVLPNIPVTLPARLLERRPDIAAAERRMASANEQVGIAKAAYYPTLNLAASAGLEGSSILNWLTWPSRFWAVGPQLSETLFDAGRRRATTESARAGYDAKHVHVTCCCEPDEVSITVEDEGRGFDISNVPDPTAPENIVSVHGRGIHVIKALMDEVRFEEGGAVIHMRKNASEASKLLAKDAQENSTK